MQALYKANLKLQTDMNNSKNILLVEELYRLSGGSYKGIKDDSALDNIHKLFKSEHIKLNSEAKALASLITGFTGIKIEDRSKLRNYKNYKQYVGSTLLDVGGVDAEQIVHFYQNIGTSQSLRSYEDISILEIGAFRPPIESIIVIIQLAILWTTPICWG